MPLLTLEGIYRDGKIELSERPAPMKSPTRVLVTFLPAGATPEEAAEREAARLRAFARMNEGLSLGGPPHPKRDELYDRHP